MTMFFLDTLLVYNACFTKANNFLPIQIANNGICELNKVKYTDEKVHSSTQTDDREKEGKSVVIFVTIYIFY